MPTAYQSLVIGIISGIITAALIYLITEIFRKILIPWYRQMIYRGVDISGEWMNEINLETGNRQTISASIIQKANKISGEITIVKNRNGKQYGSIEMFNMTGELRDRFLYAIIRPTDPKRIGIASLLLEIVGDGSKMRGATAWYDASAAIIAGKSSEWRRITQQTRDENT